MCMSEMQACASQPPVHVVRRSYAQAWSHRASTPCKNPAEICEILCVRVSLAATCMPGAETSAACGWKGFDHAGLNEFSTCVCVCT